MKCGLTDSETCLKAVTLALSGESTVSLNYKYNECILVFH